MRFKEVEHALRNGGWVAREAWDGKAILCLPIAGRPEVYLRLADDLFLYSFTFEDASASDWLHIPVLTK